MASAAHALAELKKPPARGASVMIKAMDLLLGLLGGIAMFAAPAACIRELSKPGMEHSPRWVLLAYGTLACLALIAASAIVIVANLGAGLIGFSAAALASWALRRRRRALAPKPRYVVEGALLEDAMSPEARAELDRLARKAEEGSLASEEADSE
jgi:small-conductance mechanosensitive channel